MSDVEKIREAIMRLSMCAIRECEICKYKDRPKSELPSEDCKERSVKNVSILANEFLRKRPLRCKDCAYFSYDKFGDAGCCAPVGLNVPDEDSFCSYGKRREEDDSEKM